MAQTFEPNRLEAFSDGVIAVIITIMVLELKVPHEGGMSGLRAVLPTLLVYGLSFMLIGIYWVNHHELIGRLKRCNNRILWANLLWMFAVSLVPFFTSWVLDHKLDSFSVQIYSACQLAAGGTFLVLRYTIDCQLDREGRTTPIALGTRIKHWASIAVYAGAIVVAAWAPRLSLAMTGLVAMFWIVPTLSLHVEESAPAEEPHRMLGSRAATAPSTLHSTTE